MEVEQPPTAGSERPKKVLSEAQLASLAKARERAKEKKLELGHVSRSEKAMKALALEKRKAAIAEAGLPTEPVPMVDMAKAIAEASEKVRPKPKETVASAPQTLRIVVEHRKKGRARVRVAESSSSDSDDSDDYRAKLKAKYKAKYLPKTEVAPAQPIHVVQEVAKDRLKSQLQAETMKMAWQSLFN